MRFRISIFILITFIQYSCTQNFDIEPSCDKVKSVEYGNNLIEYIDNNRLYDKTDIQESLIGNWLLIGIIPSWRTPFEPGKYCRSLEITDDSIKVFREDNFESNFSTPWSLTQISHKEQIEYSVTTSNFEYDLSLGFDTFSSQYIYCTRICEDCYIYIYEKIE